jgi:sugar O-acyltransferase (sialic acid O-acetyltransferase NeuD family)
MEKQALVIFGAGDIAQLAHFYFSTDSDYEVVAFTVDREYMKDAEMFGLPVIAFDEVGQHFPPATHSMFIALSYAQINALRKEKFEQVKKAGYRLASYISSRASVLTQLPVGDNCFILEDNTIQPFVSIADNVTLWSGNHIGHHSTIHSHCFLASHIVVSGGVSIDEQCFIGVNATLRDHIHIGARCVIGAGALILADTEPEGVYIGTATERSRVPSTRLRKL